MSIVIVDYDVGNLRSVQKGFENVGAAALISRDPAVIADADGLVLPGVGAFGECMANLKKYALEEAIRAFIDGGKPFLGICVGYQLLFEGSEENPGVAGLGVFRGRCARFATRPGSRMKVPHMGWNQIRIMRDCPLFEGIDDGADVYFVHSYYPIPEDPTIVVTSTDYGGVFASSIQSGSLFATQFHPEKSQRAGLRALANFARLAE
jgi:glutamine amidotransferase